MRAVREKSRPARAGAGTAVKLEDAPQKTGADRSVDWVPFYVPMTDGHDEREVREAIRSGWLTTGPKVRQFEEKTCEYVGSRHAVAVNSCTAALHVALAACGIGPGDEVVTTPYSFVATGEAILYVRAKPVFADIDPLTLNIDPESVRRAITKKTRAIIPVHMAGLACDMDALSGLARGRNIRIIEDAAHAFGTRWNGRRIGSIGDATCFSFYATKNLTTGEGGLLTTNDEGLAARARTLSLHGLSRGAWNRYSRSGSWQYDVVDLGFKYNMTDLAAGLGLAQLARFDAMQRRRADLARRYTRALGPMEVFDLPPDDPDGGHAWHLYIVRLRARALRIGRDQVIEELKERGIGTSVHFQPIHLFSYYRRTFGFRKGDFPIAERESARAISLPFYPSMSREVQERVVEAIADVVGKFRR